MSGASDETTDIGRLIQDTADRLLREQCSKELVDAAEAGTFPEALWRTLVETGLPWAAAPERLGGSGLPLTDAIGLLRLVGMHAVPVPLTETLIGAALLGDDPALAALPEGPLAIALPDAGGRFEAHLGADGWRLDGVISEVPFAPVAAQLLVAVATDDGLALLRIDPAACSLDAGRSIAGEPSADVRFDALGVKPEAVTPLTRWQTLDQLRALMALTRALMISGAMQSLLDMSVSYALERKQFGRPIAQFQAVQQQLAVLAGEAAAAIRAADGAVEAFAVALGGDDSDGPRMGGPRMGGPRMAAAVREAGVAKARAGEAAGRGAEIAHQVHGAMGFTYEHRLHHRTRRVWAWRDQYGSEHFWQARFGRELCAAGADALWDELTRPL